MMKEKVLESLNKHKDIIINYGRSTDNTRDIKETAYYDENIQKYRGETGIWSNKLLREILNGQVENVKIELIGE